MGVGGYINRGGVIYGWGKGTEIGKEDMVSTMGEGEGVENGEG